MSPNEPIARRSRAEAISRWDYDSELPCRAVQRLLVTISPGCERSRRWEIMSEGEILSRTEVLELLSQKAREGSTSAMIALERALRIGQDEALDEDDFIEELIQGGRRRDEG